jgi:hypothetical protein
MSEVIVCPRCKKPLNECQCRATETEVKITLDRSQEIEDLQQEKSNLESENEELKDTLTEIAEKEAYAKAKALGIKDPELYEPERLVRLVQKKQAEREARGSKLPESGSPLTPAQLSGNSRDNYVNDTLPFLEREYESESELIEDLKAISKDVKNPFQTKAKEVLDSLYEKAIKSKQVAKTQEFEIEGFESHSEWKNGKLISKPRKQPVLKKVEKRD